MLQGQKKLVHTDILNFFCQMLRETLKFSQPLSRTEMSQNLAIAQPQKQDFRLAMRECFKLVQHIHTHRVHFLLFAIHFSGCSSTHEKRRGQAFVKRELHRSMLFPILCCVIQGVQFENDQKSNAGALQPRIFDRMLLKQNSV